MALPWLADVLTGLVYYFAGMLTAQREARWYGSRCLGLAAALVVPTSSGRCRSSGTPCWRS